MKKEQRICVLLAIMILGIWGLEVKSSGSLIPKSWKIRMIQSVQENAERLYMPGVTYTEKKQGEIRVTEAVVHMASALIPLGNYVTEREAAELLTEDEATYAILAKKQAEEENSVDENGQLIGKDKSEETRQASVPTMDLSMERLNDFEYLVSNFYTVDSVTYINPSELNASELLGKDLRIDLSTGGSKILIYHTHSQETFADSATACLEMTLRLLGIGPGDEVITTAYTYTASASVVEHVGAKLVLVDVAKDSYEIDYEKLADAITEKTKAVIPVDLAGIMCDYDKIFEIVEAKKSLFHPANELQEKFGRVIVVADAAHAFGAERKGKKCGQVADFTSFSFHAVKNLTTAEGGAVTWRPIEGVDDEEIYKKYMLFSLHGQSKDALAKTQLGAWEYDVVAPYFKCNMTDIMASIGLVQLKRYDALLARRREIIGMYDKALESLPVTVLNHFDTDHKSSGHLYLIRVQGKTREECNEIITKMAEHGVATNVHYKPLPLLSAYKNMGFDIKDYPNAYALFENAITLPLHTKLTDEEVKYVTDVLKECIG